MLSATCQAWPRNVGCHLLQSSCPCALSQQHKGKRSKGSSRHGEGREGRGTGWAAAGQARWQCLPAIGRCAWAGPSCGADGQLSGPDPAVAETLLGAIMGSNAAG